MFKDLFKFFLSLPTKAIIAWVGAASFTGLVTLSAFILKEQFGKWNEIRNDIKDLKNEVKVQLPIRIDAGLKKLGDSTALQFKHTNSVIINHIIYSEKDARKTQEAIDRLYGLQTNAIKKNNGLIRTVYALH